MWDGYLKRTMIPAPNVWKLTCLLYSVSGWNPMFPKTWNKHWNFGTKDQFSSFLEQDLHADDGVDEEQHGNEQDDVGQGLEGLDEGPEQDSDRVALSKQFHETCGTEQTEKTDVDEVFLQFKTVKGQFEGNFRVILTANSTMSASTMLPTTVTKSKVFHWSLK